ncbi:type II toxin-antitoxin system PemK/MazF family toxin [Microbacterium aerolatum]|uniref:type II toxin-antitoxin system PemK/MazF family toxin n=1 Tax=Microbacterium aerolatum TaxID=153731 RepID=UPI0020012F3E|nr:type II toxin-antitoxin system PemK/MazF family toxin [Microbacterium aerolatum]MCK3768762.1 type II toxin-antitoxin system PemK/MazF family toxin [Microbacterium aerolatum]
MSMSLLRRGQIVLVSFDPTVGSEARKTRPAVVVSNNAANSVAARSSQATITVLPVTSNTARVLPFQVLLPADATGLDRDSKAQAEQVRTISVTRVIRPVGWVPAELMGAIDEALRVHLSL